MIALKALFPKEGASPANTVPTQLSGFEDREMPSFFLKPGIQPPSHWPCQHGCKQSSERWGHCLWLPALPSPEVSYLSQDTSLLTALLRCLCSPCSSTRCSPGISLVAEACTGTWAVHSVLHKLLKHTRTLILQLFAGCYVFIAYLNGDGFPLNSRKML